MRPSYHFSARENWLSDPNGLVHDGAQWHMFYQYNPQGEDWGHMAWGHATSTDLVRWVEHEPALLEDENHMVFSGSAVIDYANSAGFGHDAIVAVYTAAMRAVPPRQAQCLAISRDKGASWQRFAENPVLDYGLADFRDPFVFWHQGTSRWIMVVALSAENAALILTSPDLRNWDETGRIDCGDAPGNLWECPTLIELPIAGTDALHWMFKIDALHDVPGSGALYQTGSFDGQRFIANRSGWQVLDHGMDFYAAVAWNGPRDDMGRPCWIGWMGNHSYQHKFPRRGWRGVMSLPRRMELVRHGQELRLSQTVEPAVLQLFEAPRTIDAKQSSIPTACRIDLAAGYAGKLRIEDGSAGAISLERGDGQVTIAREDENLDFLSCKRSIALPQDHGLSLYLDSETCEILSSDGTVAASFQHRPPHLTLTLIADNPGEISIAPLRQCPAPHLDCADQPGIIA